MIVCADLSVLADNAPHVFPRVDRLNAIANDRLMLNAQDLLARVRKHSHVAALINRINKTERTTLVGVVVTAAVVLAFSKLADAVGEGHTRVFDEWLLLILRTPDNLSDPIGPKWFEEMMRDFTALGSTGVLTVMVLAAVGFLALTRRAHAAWFVLASVLGGVLISQTMKWAYARPRPELVPHGAEVFTASFPSGHSMMSAVVYLTLGALLARTQAARDAKAYILAVGVVLTVLVGVSRVYLGVHWPTDVLAGWVLGGLWAMLCWLAMLWLQTGGQVEDERAD
jgi:undecaprenyl-diphosphatase